MGKPVTSNVKRVEVSGLNTKVSKELITKFKDRCAYLGYPMNIVFETFMQQYANNRFELSNEDIMKWKNDKGEIALLNTFFNKEIYLGFKSACKNNGHFVKYVVSAFMEKFASGDYIMEYVNTSTIENNKEKEDNNNV